MVDLIQSLAIAGLVVWNILQQGTLGYAQKHLKALDGRGDAHQRSLDAHSERLKIHDRGR